jgi:hypothetical protein
MVVTFPKMAELEKDLEKIVVAGYEINLDEVVVAIPKMTEYETSLEEMVVAGPKIAEH